MQSLRGGKLPDTKIKIVTLQPKPIHVNDQGEAEISITVPDFNGELRIMGQVWTAGQFGMAENKITVAAPIVAEMSTPRFLAGGDETVLALDLTHDQTVTGIICAFQDRRIYFCNAFWGSSCYIGTK
ncbi:MULTISPECIES: alpha-2-macroglobulin family protein [unclassified Commensalibacter]|uniref:alpha-2-macroglobulin family protein n=1 Tax=unclassified Commensalibacter TaxID=2630218 RepID=UPI0018DD893C|nr:MULTISPECIES: alpha-2-macroglobulin family protein [unclassified Commensalibacter]MBH9970120.1 hypothetical protein [Commensalibacter sp. M0265]MBH9977694.1 hypothetical protein [Commensalibacter sp. M0266]MBH9993155.1 hypothetical protein [Commensalibacter sp. M0270]MBI0046870.1 hypothetical protein [Commensalibacter sp. M0267]MBI0056320.1 hypothetical protein [Commensalibacter sp. M0268]